MTSSARDMKRKMIRPIMMTVVKVGVVCQKLGYRHTGVFDMACTKDMPGMQIVNNDGKLELLSMWDFA